MMTMEFLENAWEFALQAVNDHSHGVLEIWVPTVLFTIAMDVWNIDTVKALLKQPDGRELYIHCIKTNILFQIVFGSFGYILSASVFCVQHDLEPWQQLMAVVGTMVGHNVIYYFIHREFHENPSWYKYHKLHHRYNAHVPPSAANAVSIEEYIIAYITPTVLCTVIIPTDVWSFTTTVQIMSILNIAVHTPKLEALSEKWLPSWWVSSHDHLEHHRKLNCHYASPSLNIDNLLEFANGLLDHDDGSKKVSS